MCSSGRPMNSAGQKRLLCRFGSLVRCGKQAGGKTRLRVEECLKSTRNSRKQSKAFAVLLSSGLLLNTPLYSVFVLLLQPSSGAPAATLQTNP